ncbi:MAG: hypothetical protein LBN03_02205 [Bifidobacteriaceae bacterium]|jgi:hypothetical protein|nr:hypothetical protein [Bifidobacteriaceae bacterium]
MNEQDNNTQNPPTDPNVAPVNADVQAPIESPEHSGSKLPIIIAVIVIVVAIAGFIGFKVISGNEAEDTAASEETTQEPEVFEKLVDKKWDDLEPGEWTEEIDEDYEASIDQTTKKLIDRDDPALNDAYELIREGDILTANIDISSMSMDSALCKVTLMQLDFTLTIKSDIIKGKNICQFKFDTNADHKKADGQVSQRGLPSFLNFENYIISIVVIQDSKILGYRFIDSKINDPNYIEPKNPDDSE